jgi:hypothetical protein
MEKKMTYVEALTIAIDAMNSLESPNKEAIDRLIALKESTEKRNNSKSKAEVAKQSANDDLKNVIVEVLTNCAEPVTITEMLALDERFNGLKVQKISPLMRKLLEEGKIKREEMKHKAYFSIA